MFHWHWKLKFNKCKHLSSSLNGLMDSLAISSSNQLVKIPQLPKHVLSSSHSSGQTVNTANTNTAKEFSLLRELSKNFKDYLFINDHNVQSQMIWNENEDYIDEDKELIEFRKTIEAQVEFHLNLNCDAEGFACCVIFDLQLI